MSWTNTPGALEPTWSNQVLLSNEILLTETMAKFWYSLEKVDPNLGYTYVTSRKAHEITLFTGVDLSKQALTVSEISREILNSHRIDRDKAALEINAILWMSIPPQLVRWKIKSLQELVPYVQHFDAISKEDLKVLVELTRQFIYEETKVSFVKHIPFTSAQIKRWLTEASFTIKGKYIPPDSRMYGTMSQITVDFIQWTVSTMSTWKNPIAEQSTTEPEIPEKQLLAENEKYLHEVMEKLWYRYKYTDSRAWYIYDSVNRSGRTYVLEPHTLKSGKLALVTIIRSLFESPNIKRDTLANDVMKIFGVKIPERLKHLEDLKDAKTYIDHFDYLPRDEFDWLVNLVIRTIFHNTGIDLQKWFPFTGNVIIGEPTTLTIDGKYINPDDKEWGKVSSIKIDFITGKIGIMREEVIG